MMPPRLTLTLTALVSLTSVAVAATVGHKGLAVRTNKPEDPTYPACDNDDGSIPTQTKAQTSLTAWDTHPNSEQTGHHLFYNNAGKTHSRRAEHGHPHHRDDPGRISDDPVVYVAPGFGSCEFNYTNSDPGVCLAPGWIRSAHVNGCNKWVEVELPSLGTSTYARVLDACGAVKDTTFGCNDAYLTLASFSALVNGNMSVIAGGRTPGPIRWKFTKEPCYACYEGLPGKLPDGKEDDCQGPDDSGFVRSGRKTGGDILTNSTEIGLKCTASGGGGGTHSTNSLGAGNTKAITNTQNLFGTSKSFNSGEFKQQLFDAFGKEHGGKQSRSMDDTWKEGQAHLWQA